MSNSVNILRNMASFDKAEQFDGFSKVVIIVSDEIEYSAGAETGRTLTLNCPWGTQEIANNILQSIKGFQYQPMTAENALVDPSVEIGDGISANGVYSGVYSLETKFNSNLPTTVSAPADEEIDYEYQYRSKQDREVKRQNKKFSSQLTIHSNQIAAEVEQRKNDVEVINGKLTVQAGQISAEVAERKSDVASLNSKLTVQAGQISAEVETRKSETESLRSTLKLQAGQIAAKVSSAGGDYASFGWNLRGPGEVPEHPNGFFEIVSNGYKQVLFVDESGLSVNGEIRATSGEIGGFKITSNSLTYNNQTWGGTNTNGIYIGPSGIQLGKNFRVDAAGNLTAASGTFTGSVNAGNIRYGGSYGTFNGGGISGGSIYGNRLVGGTITTAYTSSGINSSLGRADYAYNVLSGVSIADYIGCYKLAASTYITTPELQIGGWDVERKSKSFKDGKGNTVTINYWGY